MIEQDLTPQRVFDLEIAPDWLSVYLILKINLTTHEDLPELSFILDFIKQSGVVFGLKQKLLDRRSTLFTAFKVNRKLLIAEGIPPMNGQDGHPEFFVDLDNKQKHIPQVGKNGRVNFRELNYVVNVPGGFLLAQLIPPTLGQDGTDVFGSPIVAVNGARAELIKGKNVTRSLDGTKYFAKCAGMPVYKNNKLDIQKKIQIEGNINYSIGNVHFVGDLEILGDVEQGFFVEAGKSISINGNAIGGSIQAGRDLIVKNGIISADRNTVKVAGSIAARFIENSAVQAGRDITVSRWVLHNRMECGGIIRLGDEGEGMIMGGTSQAGIGIISTEIGTDMFIKTLVQVDYNPDYYKTDELFAYFAVLKRELYLVQDMLDKAYANIEAVKASTLLHLYQKASVIDEITERVFEGHNTKKKLETELEDFRLFLLEKKYILEPVIIARERVWPGVEVRINGTSLKIRKNMGPVVFGFEEGRITVTKLEDKQHELHWLY